MKLRGKHNYLRGGDRSGATLLETLVYIPLFFLITSMAFTVFYRTNEQSRALRRSADDITGSLAAGERWRADVRAATQPPTLAEGKLVLKQGAAEVTYFMRSNVVWRQVSTARPERIISGVLASEFKMDQRQFTTAWQWHLELKKHRQTSNMRPLFTFTAVPPRRNAP